MKNKVMQFEAIFTPGRTRTSDLRSRSATLCPLSYGRKMAEGRGFEPRSPCGRTGFRDRLLAIRSSLHKVIVECLQRSCKQNYQHSGRNKHSAVSTQENPICRDYLLKADR